MPLDDRDRRLTVHRLRSIRAAISPGSSTVAAVVDQFADQVEAGADPVWLDLSGLDGLYGQLHWTAVLESLSPPMGRLRCMECGEGSVPTPRRLTKLLGEYVARYQLAGFMADLGERQKVLDLPADPAARARVLAERKAEQARIDAARKREEESSKRRVLPGTLAEGEPVYEAPPAGLKEFFPIGRGA